MRLATLGWCISLCLGFSCCGVLLSEAILRFKLFRTSLQAGRRGGVIFREGDRVVCLATAPGRFEEGDVGVVVSLNGTQAFVRLDKGVDADSQGIPIGQFCLRKLDAHRPQRRVGAVRAHSLEELLLELFRLHDLNGNGCLEEIELIKLNEKIAMLHYGKDVDKQAVKTKYRDLFRTKLDASGQAVLYPTFRAFMQGVLDGIDPDVEAQEMILEQFIAEARSAREAFYWSSMASESDAPFLPHISYQELNKTIPELAIDG